MIEKLKHKYALSENGAKNMIKAFVAVTIANLVLMLPVGLLYQLTTAERHIHRQSVLEYISYTDFGGLYNIYTGFTPLYSHIFSPHFGQITNFFTSVVSSLSSGISCCG